MILLIEKPKEIPKGMGMANSNPGLPLLLLVGLFGALHQACAQARSLSADKDADFSELEGVVKTIEVTFPDFLCTSSPLTNLSVFLEGEIFLH